MPYQTTSMEQNEGIENAGPCKSSLDEEVKNDLRKSHFVVGKFDPDYNTKYRSEYYDFDFFNTLYIVRFL